MSNKILRLSEVMDLTALSRSSIYQFIKDKEFPPQIQLGARAVGWLESEINEWLEIRIQARGFDHNVEDMEGCNETRR